MHGTLRSSPECQPTEMPPGYLAVPCPAATPPPSSLDTCTQPSTPAATPTAPPTLAQVPPLEVAHSAVQAVALAHLGGAEGHRGSQCTDCKHAERPHKLCAWGPANPKIASPPVKWSAHAADVGSSAAYPVPPQYACKHTLNQDMMEKTAKSNL